MHECMIDAAEELKRVDHLIYVSLKYTRTVDVIKNIIERFISTYDCLILALLTKLKDEGKIESIPDSPVEKVNLVNEKFAEPIVKENVALYLLYRKIIKAECRSAQEYRRHVTMTCIFKDGSEMNIDIDKIYEFYKKAKEFVDFIKKVGGNND